MNPSQEAEFHAKLNGKGFKADPAVVAAFDACFRRLAFGVLSKRYSDPKQRQNFEDLYQDALINVMNRLEAGGVKAESFRNYLITSCIRNIQNEYRRQTHQLTVTCDDPDNLVHGSWRERTQRTGEALREELFEHELPEGWLMNAHENNYLPDRDKEVLLKAIAAATWACESDERSMKRAAGDARLLQWYYLGNLQETQQGYAKRQGLTPSTISDHLVSGKQSVKAHLGSQGHDNIVAWMNVIEAIRASEAGKKRRKTDQGNAGVSPGA